MAKPLPFYEACSPAKCKIVLDDARAEADRPKDVTINDLGGLAVRVIPVEVPIMGEQPKKYTVKEHGLGLEFRRCKQVNWLNKKLEKKKETCTAVYHVNVPQNTLKCYSQVNSILESLRVGSKASGPETPKYKVISAIACSRSGVPPTRVAEPIEPSVIAVITGTPLSKVRKALEPLVKSGQVNCGGYKKGKKEALLKAGKQLKVQEKKKRDEKIRSVLNEKKCFIPKPYLTAFDEFIKGETEARKWAGFQKVFGKLPLEKTRKAIESPDLPEYVDYLEAYKIGGGGIPEKTRLVKPFIPTSSLTVEEFEQAQT